MDRRTRHERNIAAAEKECERCDRQQYKREQKRIRLYRKYIHMEERRQREQLRRLLNPNFFERQIDLLELASTRAKNALYESFEILFR